MGLSTDFVSVGAHKILTALVPPWLFCVFPRLPLSGGLRILDVESAVLGQALLDEVLSLERKPEYSNNAGFGYSVILVFPVDIVADGPCARTDLLFHFLFLSALTGGAVPVDPRRGFGCLVSLCFSSLSASLRCSSFDVLGSTGAECLTAVLGADFRHGGLATVPAGTGLGVVPVPFGLVFRPLAASCLEFVLVGFGVATDPEPGPAKLDLKAVQAEQDVQDLPELFGGLGGGFGLAGGVGLGLGVVSALEDFEERVMLSIDLLHGLGAAATVWVVLHGQTAIGRLELVQGLDILEVFHGVFSSHYFLVGWGF